MAEGVARSPDLPTRIGRHHVLGYLADGGMAEIFLAEQNGRPVVIKRILPHLARQQNFVSMFVDEARIGSLVHHPNVVEVYELGQVGLDLFLVMEYLAGENTHGIMRRLTTRRERLPLALAAHIVAEAAAGLHCAHELCDESGTPLHLVHRDISLSNIFVTYSGEVKVLDFGIATAAHRLTRTATGQVKGKFSYMSPEQCRGEPLDLRSDIFSLGVVLFELTTQRRLFKRANELMVLKAVTELPIPRPTREVHGYPRELEDICMRALSRDPDTRYPTALALREDLISTISLLGGGSDLRAPLAGTMGQLFPERIEEKRKLLSLVRAGSLADMHVPAAEVDENVEVPQITEQSATSVPPSVVPAPVPRGKPWPLFVAALALGAIAIAVYWFGVREDEQQQQAKPTVSAGSAAPAPGSNAASEIVVHVDSMPPGAQVAVDGITKGTTPFDLHLEAAKTIKLELELAGYVSIAQELPIDRDQRILIPMVVAPKEPKAIVKPPESPQPPAHPPKRPTGKRPPATKGSDDPFQRYD